MIEATSYQPVSAPKLHEIVVRKSTVQILNGVLHVGASLPSEPILAQQFGVSRTVVIREAVRVLASKVWPSFRSNSICNSIYAYRSLHENHKP